MANQQTGTRKDDDGPRAGEGASTQVEAEAKFALGADDPVPDLSPLITPGEVREHRLRAVYLDTPDLFLLRHRVTLRRREGGGDAGWHVKLPAEGARLEVHGDLGEGDGRWEVPAAHLEALAEHLGEEWSGRTGADRGLVPVAVLRTDRTETELLDADGTPVAVLADDAVAASPSGERWRELEVELLPGADPQLLPSVVDHLAGQGVAVADSPSKLGRALADRRERTERGKGPRRKGPASDVVLQHLAEQLAVLRGRAEDVRADAPDAVHKSRVATRRMRSALRTFRSLFDRAEADALQGELKWLAAALGAPRDAEVVRERVLAEIAAVPRRDYEGPVKRSAAAELDRRHAAAHAALVEVLDSRRCAALLDRLTEFVADPPLRPRASEPARDVLPGLVAKAVRRVRRTHAQARAAEGAERLELLHETRKRAKAVRYAYEALAPTFGASAAAQARLWEAVTESLGQVQDLDVAVETVRSLRRVAEAAGEPTYTHGWLVGRLTAQQEPAVEAGERALESALAEAFRAA